MWDSAIIRKSLRFYAVTERSILQGYTFSEALDVACQNGISFLQLREKNIATSEFLALGKEVRKVAQKYQIPFVINDDVALAKAVQADGVHVGQSDAACQKARAILGPEKIIGVTVSTVAEALEAEKQGADYLGVGAMYATDSKTNARVIAPQILKEITQAVQLPVVAIGGLKANNLEILKNSGVDGVAVISAIFAEKDIKKACQNLLQAINQVIV